MKFLILTLILLISSNVMAKTELNLYSEYAWQFFHLVDSHQTYQMAKNPDCFNESNFLTRKLIGRNPHPDKVIAWALLSSVAHVLVFNWVDDHFSREDRNIFIRGLDLGSKVKTVHGNYEVGIGFSGLTRSGRDYCDKVRENNQVNLTIMRF